MNALWAIFLTLQVVGAGNINYQQAHGYYEINPIYHIYGDRYPSKEQVYLTKGLEVLAIYGATKVFPQYKKEILSTAVAVQVGFFIYDGVTGVEFGLRF